MAIKNMLASSSKSGLINKVAVTPANITDAKGFKHVCPSQGAVYAEVGILELNQLKIQQLKNECI